MNRKRKDNPRLCISHVPLILLMLCLYVKEGFVVFLYFFSSIFQCYSKKHVLCNERNVLSTATGICVKTLNVIVLVSQMNFPTDFGKQMIKSHAEL